MIRFKVAALALVVVGLGSGCKHIGAKYHENSYTLADARVTRDTLNQAMTDSAMRGNMVVANYHFEPHSARLNTLGRQTLDRYAVLLGQHGGVLRLESRSLDESFNSARMQEIRNQLAVSGIPDERISLEVGLSGGRGLQAVEAIAVKAIHFAPEREALTDLLTGSTGSFGVEGGN